MAIWSKNSLRNRQENAKILVKQVFDVQEAAGNRLFVESAADGCLHVLPDVEALEALMACLERRGAREGQLHVALSYHRDAIAHGLPASTLS